MGKSTNGPGMADCAVYAQEITKQTQYSVTLLVELDGSQDDARWRVHALGTRGGSIDPLEGRSVSATVLWPHREYATFSGAVFCVLAWLDSLIAQDRFQEITRG
jgi:hypothetical protein